MNARRARSHPSETAARAALAALAACAFACADPASASASHATSRERVSALRTDGAAVRRSGTDLVAIPGGRYRPLYRQPSGPATLDRRVASARVESFRMERRPVTNAEFLAFVHQHPEWRRSRVSRLFADTGYLKHWRGDLDPGPRAPAASPVVDVSWFAARAFLAARGERLPTVAEWEYVALADERVRDASGDPRFLARLRDAYEQPAPRVWPPVGRGWRNVYGVEDLHGLVWEWTLDFDSALVTGESRADGTVDRNLYCGGGAASAADFRDYAAFMRFAFRGSLEARYTTSSLGFRGVLDAAALAARKDAP